MVDAPGPTTVPIRAADPSRERRGRRLLQHVGLLVVSLSLSFLLAEAAWRLLISSQMPLGQRLRNPRLYADPFSDDLFWLLRHRWQGHLGPFKPPAHPHPRLGWRNALINDDFSHAFEGEVGDRRPVLLYGDSFAQSMPGVERFETILNGDEGFSRDHFLLNYGVGGYGVDQIYLLFDGSIDRFENPFVIFSLMTFDLDRSVLSVRIGQKPYFEVVEGELELRGVPIDDDPERYFAHRPPRVGSYVLRRLGQLAAGPEAASTATAEKKRINGAILERAIADLERRGLDYVIFVFHARKAFIRQPDWRSAWLKATLEAHGVPFMWSYDILQQQAPDTEIDELFDPRHVHPTSKANHIFARAMAEEVLSTRAQGGGAPRAAPDSDS